MADMPRERSAEEIRRLKREGIVDVGTTYLTVRGWTKLPKHKFWDGYVPPEEQ